MKQLFIFLSAAAFVSCCPETAKQDSPKPLTVTGPLEKTVKNDLVKDSTIILKCRYTDLSNMLDFNVQFRRVINEADFSLDSSFAYIAVYDKHSKKVDSINFQAIHYYDFFLENCDDARSYSTGKNKNAEVVDNDYGKFIVADFNFDSREDFAVMTEMPNSGAMYAFYIQNEAGKFQKDNFLTDSMMYFPNKFIRGNTTLQTMVPCGACGLSQISYKYVRKTKSWKIARKRMIDVCG